MWRVTITLPGNSGKQEVKLSPQSKNKSDPKESSGKSIEKCNCVYSTVYRFYGR